MTVVDHGAQGRGKTGSSLLNISVTFDRFEHGIQLSQLPGLENKILLPHPESSPQGVFKELLLVLRSRFCGYGRGSLLSWLYR